MKGFRKAILMVLALSLIAPAAWAETDTEGWALVDFFSSYVWRGQKLSDNWVIQPDIGVYYGGFSADLWANYDSDIEEHNETDLTLSYTHEIEKLSLEIGWIYYALDGYEDTQEAYLSVSYDIVLSPSLTYYYDYDQGDGGFLTFSLSHSFDLPQNMALNLGASVGVNFENEVMGVNMEGDTFTNFYNGEVTASLTIPLHENFTLEPKVGYTISLSDDAEDAIESISYDEDSSILYGGVNLTLSF